MTRMPMIEGIDVSHHNGRIDWQAVAAAGIRFAWAKCTEGKWFDDWTWPRNLAGAIKAGVLVGGYHYWRPDVPPRVQAEHFLRRLNPDSEMLLPAIDVEERGLSRQATTASILAMAEYIEAKIGRAPIIYTYDWFGRHLLGAELARFPLWIARYSRFQPRMPIAGWSDWAFWQYTSKGRIRGIQGYVDRNRFRGTLAELLQYTIGGAGYVPGPIKIVMLPGNQIIECNAVFDGERVRCDLRALAEALGAEVHDHVPDQRKVYLRRGD